MCGWLGDCRREIIKTLKIGDITKRNKIRVINKNIKDSRKEKGKHYRSEKKNSYNEEKKRNNKSHIVEEKRKVIVEKINIVEEKIN